MDKDTMIEELAKELGICLDDEGSGRFATRYPHGQVAFGGDQLMYVLLLKRDLAYWKDARKPRWIPCTERMPEAGLNVLIWVDDESHVAYFSQDSRRWLDSEGDWARVTHWMPLPEGPE